jgi:hypothetical protein
MSDDPDTGATIVLHLTIRGDEPIQGSVDSGDGSPPCQFVGWVQLMSAVNLLKLAHLPSGFDPA